MKSRPTLKDIAAELNLSHPTVSRALANHASISEETKANVREVARRLGYVANSSARMLRRGHSDVVGALLPDLTNEFYAAVAQRLADDCSRQGRQLVLSISAGDPQRELALVRTLIEARPAGLIVALDVHTLPETIDYLAGTHCVQFLVAHPGLQGPVVTVEDSGGARIAMEHLLGLGHRRIGFVGPAAETVIGDARLRGVRQALKGAGIELESELVRLGSSTAEFGFEAVQALMRLPKPPTAVYLSTAPLSQGGVRALSALGIRTPEDVSVVVAGSAVWYDIWPGGLTSVTLPMAELADSASSLVMKRPRKLRGGGAQVIQHAFVLVPRGSTARCPARSRRSAR